MKKVLLNLVLLSLLILPTIALAQEREAPLVEIMPAITRITNWAFTILMVIAVLCIIIAAFFFVTAAGDAERVTTARTWLMYALIGVAVALVARGLVALMERIIVG